jgi:RNA polymerase sigma-70 factor, ECF subfamily
VERHLPAIRRLLAGLFNGAAEDIEDAEQEVLAALYTGIAGFRFQSSFRTFLYRLCRNTAIDILRSKGRERRRVEAAAREALVHAGHTGEAGFDPDTGLMREESRRALQKALALLAPDERLLIIMRESEGMAVEEMARVLSIPSGTVKSRLHRSREKLARLLGGMK